MSANLYYKAEVKNGQYLWHVGLYFAVSPHKKPKSYNAYGVTFQFLPSSKELRLLPNYVHGEKNHIDIPWEPKDKCFNMQMFKAIMENCAPLEIPANWVTDDMTSEDFTDVADSLVGEIFENIDMFEAVTKAKLPAVFEVKKNVNRIILSASAQLKAEDGMMYSYTTYKFVDVANQNTFVNRGRSIAITAKDNETLLKAFNSNASSSKDSLLDWGFDEAEILLPEKRLKFKAVDFEATINNILNKVNPDRKKAEMKTVAKKPAAKAAAKVADEKAVPTTTKAKVNRADMLRDIYNKWGVNGLKVVKITKSDATTLKLSDAEIVALGLAK